MEKMLQESETIFSGLNRYDFKSMDAKNKVFVNKLKIILRKSNGTLLVKRMKYVLNVLCLT